MRPGLKSYSTEEEDNRFYSLIPSIFVGAVEQREKTVGPVDHVEVAYERIDQAFFRVQGGILCVTCEPGAMKEVSTKIRAKYPAPSK